VKLKIAPVTATVRAHRLAELLGVDIPTAKQIKQAGLSGAIGEYNDDVAAALTAHRLAEPAEEKEASDGDPGSL